MIDVGSARISHLLRRTTFGCRPYDWKSWSSLSHTEAVSRLIDYDKVPDTLGTIPVDELGGLVAPQDTDALKRYWLWRFCATKRPLEETMTLFWHWHFATADFKVQNPSLEWRQNQTFRRLALGSFRDLLGEMARDPAMLVWLDGNNSKKAAPNENFSRELMELFTMGVNSGYSEHDVKEGAKSFTGWSWDDDRSNMIFHEKDHNTDVKTYLGKEGNFDISDTLDIVVKHPATGRFLSKKLFQFFVHENPPPEELDRLSKIYFDSNYSMKELVRGVLNSPHFYSDAALYSQIKFPVQYAVMIVKSLDLPNKWMNDMQSYADRMGQQLFNPPNVKGWKIGQNWINTNSMTARLNFATHAVDQLRYRNLAKDHLTTVMASYDRDADHVFSAPDIAVQSVWGWLLPSVRLPEETATHLEAYLTAGQPKTLPKDYYWRRAPGLIELVMTCPEYQLA